MNRKALGVCILLLLLAAGSLRAQDQDEIITDFAGANVNVGERLFLETRFSQYFFTNSAGDANAVLPGDPTVANLLTTNGVVPGPFSGQAMSCRQCHLVDEMGYGPFGNNTLGNRTYADFARRSPIPLRDDGRVHTTRNSQPLVDALLPRNSPLFLHHDGQFASAHDLIIGTLTGRNFGWKPSEYQTAVHHIANVIRNDDGMGYLATEARNSRFEIEQTYLATYSNIFGGFSDYSGSFIWDPRALTADLISPAYQLDMRNSTDEQILETIASLIEAYLRNLTFSQDSNGVDFTGVGTPIFNGSPFDTFLIKNNLPRIPNINETSTAYSQRLLQLVSQLASPQFVTNGVDGEFTTHVQQFQFGQSELDGLKIFLAAPDYARSHPGANIGNCAACHAPPAFTDFIFHNNGAAQEEYDSTFGTGAFNLLAIPGFAERQTNYDAYLPPTPMHPCATGVFETAPATNQPGQADLGLWNVYANPDFPAPQAGLQQIMPQLLNLAQPQIRSTGVTNGQFVFNGVNGSPGGIYYVLASEDLTQPVTNWTALATNTFDSQGGFTFVAPGGLAPSRSFYRVAAALPSPDATLPHMIALFKTPTLRDLDHSAPYLHTGRMDSFEQVIQFYQNFSGKARLGQIRNADPELSAINLDGSAVAPLAAFLRSLNEDYTD